MNKITQAVIDLGGEWPEFSINDKLYSYRNGHYQANLGMPEFDYGGTYVCTREEFEQRKMALYQAFRASSQWNDDGGFPEWLKTYTEENWSEEDEQRMDIVGSNGPSGEHYGLKDDSKKPRYDLLPAAAIEDMAQVLTFGADKYGAENWRKVENATARYQAAMLRHAFAMQRGEGIDPETGISHAAHVMCCAAFICELQGE